MTGTLERDSLGRRLLAEAVASSEISQNAEARAMGMTPGYLSQILAGQGKPGRDVSWRIWERHPRCSPPCWDLPPDAEIPEFKIPTESSPAAE